MRSFSPNIRGEFMGADVSDIQEHLAYQFNIVGEAEGIFYVEVKDGKLYVEPYEYFDRDVISYQQRGDTAEDCRRETGSGAGPLHCRSLKVEGNIEKALRFKELVEAKRGSGKK